MRLIMALALGLVLIGQSTTASAAAASEENTPVEVGLGVGSVLGTVVYAPFKTVFCILGGISSVGTLIFDPKMAGRVAELVAEVLNVIRDLARLGMTMLIATHEMGFARDIADRVCFLDAGVILEEGPPDQMFAAPRNERTKQFLQRIIEAGRM